MEQFLQPPASAPAAAVHPPIGGFFPNYGSLIPACFPLSMAPPAPLHGAPSRLSLAAGTTVDFRHPPHTLDSSKLLARPPHYAMQNFPGYFPAALPTNYPGAMARPQSGFIPVTANTGVCGSHYDLFGGGGSKDKDLNAAEEESHNLSSRLSDASSSPKPSIQDDTSQENVISSSCPRSHEAGYGGTADWPGTTVAAESGGKTMDLDSGNVVVSAAADPENPDGSSQTGEEGGSGGGRKYPDYCRTITVKDAHGQTKELVFPRALDLDRPKRARTTFSPDQLLTLEREFRHNQYLVGRERTELAERLGLSETQVKVWFQNRRTKHKRDKQRDLPPPGPPDCGLFHMPPTNQSVAPALPPSSLFRQGASSFHRPFHM